MRKNIFFGIVYTLAAVVVLVNTFCYIKESLFFDIEELPQGTLSSSAVSPDGKKQVKVYLVSNSLGNAVRAELIEGSKTKNIFWQTGIDDTTVLWLNEEQVLINKMSINVAKGDDYDCRRGTSLFQEGEVHEAFEPNHNR